MRRVVLAALAAAALCACGGDEEPTVTILDRSFEPRTITVEAGTTLRWASRSDQAHTVTVRQDEMPPGASYFSSGGFDSERLARSDVAGGLITRGEFFSVTLEHPGAYRYYCIPHEDEGMEGAVVVSE